MSRPGLREALVGVLLALVWACGPPARGPGEITWDRDVCERCQMTISDPRFAAQIRSADDHRLHLFDDLGCALLWQEEHEQSGHAVEELWVANRAGDGWLAAGEARYEDGQPTPMNHGIRVAEADMWQTALTLELARQRIVEREHERRAPRR